MRFALLTAAAGVSLSFALLAAGAPGVKEKVDPDKAETADMYPVTTQNLRLIALAWHNYESAQSKFPGNVVKDGKALLSWRVVILQYMELAGDQSELYRSFKLDEPWDSDHNKKLIDKMPKIYAPLRGKAKAGETFYQSFLGTNAILRADGLRVGQITYGLSNTFMVAEAEEPVIWTKPDDIAFDGKTAPALGGMFKDHFFVAFGDGSVRKVPKKLDAQAVVAHITINGGEVTDLDAAIAAAEKK